MFFPLNTLITAYNYNGSGQVHERLGKFVLLTVKPTSGLVGQGKHFFLAGRAHVWPSIHVFKHPHTDVF